ncbi:MAG TPA: hypothetical protein VN758_12770 [Solirubrobacterales bacterium]|nr:hypothetical protein [Solirubrobacterales bacterium]
MPIDRRQILRAIDAEWPKAVQYAAGLRDQDLSLWKSEKRPQELKDVAAQWFPPEIDPDPPHGFSLRQYKEATSETMWLRHRIVVHLDYDFPDGLERSAVQALLGGLLRHELEHARQYALCPHIFDLFNGLIKPTLFQAFGGSIPGAYLNCVPIELDANAAAASYLRDFHTEHIEAIRTTDCANLTRASSGPQPLDTLLVRMVSFLYVFRGSAEERFQPLAVRSYFQSEDAKAIWDRLVDAEQA